MTEPQTTNVEYEELMARAVELEAPMPGQPTDNSEVPCNLAMVQRATQDVGMSADFMRDRLGQGERERARFAESLRNAAKAYEETDENVAEGLNSETSISPVLPKPVADEVDPVTLGDGDTPYVMAAGDSEYLSVENASQQIAAGDQGASLTRFADAWEAYQRTLRQAAVDPRSRFRNFQHWWNESSAAAEASLEAQRSWLDSMAGYCGQLAGQAKDVVSAHKLAVSKHPTVAQVAEVNTNMYLYYCQGIKKTSWPYKDICQNSRWDCPVKFWSGAIESCQFKDGDENKTNSNRNLTKRHADMQAKSEETLAEYQQKARLPLTPLSPPKPPPAHYIPPPPEPEPEPEPEPGPNPDDLPFDGGGLPDTSGMMPSVPTLPTTPNDKAMKDALKDAFKGAPGLPKGGPGLKPAGLGGGGGLGGAPAMPLQPSVDAEAASRPAAAGPGGASLGRGIPGTGGAMGGGMGGGMAPMAPGAGQGQNAGKGKRMEEDDDALYVEDRSWTEGVIGNRPRKGAASDK
jgi:hypothetical protein